MPRPRSGRRAALGGAVVFVCLALSSPIGSPSASGQRFPDSGVVIAVADGDSLRVRFADGVERRVRLIGVDSPELDSWREEEALRALVSKRFAFFHLYRRSIHLEYDETPVDAFGRVLAYLRLADGELFNELIIREGYARAFLRYPFRRDYRDRFARAEADARAAGKGFWQNRDPDIIPPSGARRNLGRLARVRFTCAAIAERRGFVFLASADGDFEALVPRERRRAFPQLDSLVGRTLVVSGFLEEFGGRPQVVVAFPSQLVDE